MRYAAFLRGINVGGNKIVKMDELKKTFESLGFKNVKTVLASGNVVFESAGAPSTAKIGEKLAKTFGHEIGTIVKSIDSLEEMNSQNPFKGITVTPETRLYVTFLSEKPKSKMKTYESPGGEFRILRVSGSEIYSVAIASEAGRTVDLMSVIEKEFGKKVTTRNWNTIMRILKS